MVDNRSIRPTELPAQPGLVRLMCDGIPGGIFRCLPDPVWTILEVSRGFLNLFGYTAEEMREKFHNHYLDMIHPHDRRAVTARFRSIWKPERTTAWNTGQSTGMGIRSGFWSRAI